RHTIFKCDWSSDVCSSDLVALRPVEAAQILPAARGARPGIRRTAAARRQGLFRPEAHAFGFLPDSARPAAAGARVFLHYPFRAQIGRASCRERVEVGVVSV